MLLSYMGVPYNKMHVLKDAILAIKSKHKYIGEIKWSNLFANKEQFYNDLIDFFFSTDLVFRSIVIKKENIKKEYQGDSFDSFYYKMYYQLLYHKINMEYNYNIYIDIKDTLSAKKVHKLKEIIRIDYSSIRTIQNIHSKESVFMQFADFVMGAINYKLNVVDDLKKGKVSKLKNEIIARIEKASGHSLDRGTSRGKEKFNLFFIELR